MRVIKAYAGRTRPGMTWRRQLATRLPLSMRISPPLRLFMNVLDVKFSESKQRLAAIEKARAEQVSQTPKVEENLEELVDEYEEKLEQPYPWVRSEHQIQSFLRASAARLDSEIGAHHQGTSDAVVSLPLEAADGQAGDSGSSDAGGRPQVIRKGGFDGVSGGANAQRATLNDAFGQPGTDRTEEAAKVPKPEPGLSNQRRLQPPFECVPLYPWNTSPIFKHVD